MHGGKAGLFCPVQTCKRSTGSGFTRKENLTEHLRRVHTVRNGSQSELVNLHMRQASEGSQALLNSQSRTQPQNVSTQRILLPAIRDPQEDINANGKRMHTFDPGAHDREEDLYSENKRLRRETEVKDAQIKQLQDRVRALESAQGLGGSQQ